MRLALLALALVTGCTRHNDGNTPCTPGQQLPCACIGGSTGVQICDSTGSGLGACLGCPGGPQLDLSMADFASMPGDLAGFDFSPGPDLARSRDMSIPGNADLSCSQASCLSPIAANAGCGDHEVCGNGLDDNCIGGVDEGCPCRPGDVQRCFPGAPGKRGVGACRDGYQTCTGSGALGTWGECVGSLVPSAESCDQLDNDCNGCADDGLCCNAVLSCPAPGDPRIAPVGAYSNLALQGGLFFSGSASTWKWTVQGGPCDRLFASADFTPVQTPAPQTFTLSNANGQNASLHFLLLGDYTITLTVVDTLGATFTCKWVQKVVGPGVRFELCWDHQGSATQGGADLDLHIHKFDGPSPGPWFETAANTPNPHDCYYANCSANDFQLAGGANFGYANSTPDTNCKGAKDGAIWDALGFCSNPRLDQDNTNDVGLPENSNVDDPTTGDTIRAMVHYYGQDGAGSTGPVDEHPIVNIYCGGSLLATYGQKPDPIPSGFNFGSALTATGTGLGMLWRVADVQATGTDVMGNTTCTVTPLHLPATTSGYWVITDQNNTDFSY